MGIGFVVVVVVAGIRAGSKNFGNASRDGRVGLRVSCGRSKYLGVVVVTWSGGAELQVVHCCQVFGASQLPQRDLATVGAYMIKGGKVSLVVVVALGVVVVVEVVVVVVVVDVVGKASVVVVIVARRWCSKRSCNI